MDDASPGGRPRSKDAHRAVLHAVDDLLVDVGYTAMTIRGIADRAGVGRQTIYRWWSTKAEILLEACVEDARKELAITAKNSTLADLTSYLAAVTTFLNQSPAGAAYRALLGEALHDPAVAALLETVDVLGDSAQLVLARCAARADTPELSAATADLVPLLIGPVFYRVLAGRPPVAPRTAAQLFLRSIGVASGRPGAPAAPH